MKKNSSSPEGAAGLFNALSSKHTGGLLDNLGGFFGGGVDDSDMQDGTGILGHILGGKESKVENAIGSKLGIDAGTIGKILKIAAPIVLNYLGKQKQESGVTSSEGIGGMLSGLLGGDDNANKQQSMVESLLDQDNDGSVLDDIAGMVLNSGSKDNEGGIGGMLGGLFGK